MSQHESRIALFIDPERVQHPLQVIHSVFAPVISVAQQIIHPIAIELRRDQCETNAGVWRYADIARQVFQAMRIETYENLIDHGSAVRTIRASIFVMEVKHLLYNVRERSVTEVVEQGAGAADDSRLRAN